MLIENRRRIIAVLLSAFFCLAITALSHPPVEVTVKYRPKEKQIITIVVHRVNNVKTHYIKSLTFMVNGETIGVKEYKEQPDKEGFECKWKLDRELKNGDKIEVRADCNKKGSITGFYQYNTAPPKPSKRIHELAVEENRASVLLKLGTRAPDFILHDQDLKTYHLKDFKNKKNVVLVFYPGDDTPGCTKQLCAIRDDFPRFKDADTVIFGVNPQSADSHKGFINKNDFPFPLLVDSKGNVAKVYGCWKEEKIIRTVYAIDKNGKIVFAKRGMPKNAEIMKALGIKLTKSEIKAEKKKEKTPAPEKVKTEENKKEKPGPAEMNKEDEEKEARGKKK